MRAAGGLLLLLLIIGGAARAESCIAPGSRMIVPFVGLWRASSGASLIIKPGGWRWLAPGGKPIDAHLVAPGQQTEPNDQAMDCSRLDRDGLATLREDLATHPEGAGVAQRLGDLAGPPWPMILVTPYEGEIRYVLADSGHLLELNQLGPDIALTLYDRVAPRR